MSDAGTIDRARRRGRTARRVALVVIALLFAYPGSYMALRVGRVLVLRWAYVGPQPHPTRGMVEADFSRIGNWFEIGHGPFDEFAFIEGTESPLDVRLRRAYAGPILLETWLRGFRGSDGPRARYENHSPDPGG